MGRSAPLPLPHPTCHTSRSSQGLVTHPLTTCSSPNVSRQIWATEPSPRPSPDAGPALRPGRIPHAAAAPGTASAAARQAAPAVACCSFHTPAGDFYFFGAVRAGPPKSSRPGERNMPTRRVGRPVASNATRRAGICRPVRNRRPALRCGEPHAHISGHASAFADLFACHRASVFAAAAAAVQLPWLGSAPPHSMQPAHSVSTCVEGANECGVIATPHTAVRPAHPASNANCSRPQHASMLRCVLSLMRQGGGYTLAQGTGGANAYNEKHQL